MQHKITLRAARLNCNLSLQEVSRLVNISIEDLIIYEEMPGKTPYDDAFDLSRLYRLSLDHIDFEA